ncbi:MAG TPA: DEAD/DEAH box helicase, partial [Candidatus Thermoplasmatota archaeon]|nr:DEAD/DEAH box helicase [Candidatus Thermoplasmatota archaeon]
MRIQDLDLPPRVAEAFARAGYDVLWPSQEEAAPIAASGGNLVLAVPTASGKSLVAYLALLSRAARGGKGLYVVPLRALASEKFEDLKALSEPLGLRIGLAMGDLDAADPQLARLDVLVCTSEKADALLRHKAQWLTQVACVVADEVHLLDDADRGPTLEVLLARFRQLNPRCQVVALSATIQNSAEIARWLRATHVRSEWRPVELREGTLWGKAITFAGGAAVEVESSQEDASLALAEDSVSKGGQVLLFVGTRKSTEAAAEKLAGVLEAHLDGGTRNALAALAKEIASDEEGTTVEKRLARCVKGGAAFHHAGLKNRERQLVERAFKGGLVKAISATPTLAAGVNLPARRVIVRDLRRYDADEGNQPIPVLEYKQMAGRAGRPKYDKVGEAVTIAKSFEERSEILLNYILAEPERVTSKLGTETALRVHLLASVAGGFVEDEAGLKEFVKHTFYAEQGDVWTIETRITAVLDFLLEHEFLESKGDKLAATKLGRRVSELYIDPASAVKLRAALDAAAERGASVASLGWLHAVCATPDVRPMFLRRTDEWVGGEVESRESEFLLAPPGGLDYEWFLAEAKTAFLLEDWIEEVHEDDLFKKYGAYPGDVRSKVDAAEWLLYATQEIARLLKRPVQRDLARLTTRVHHGAKAELLALLAFRGVGRWRARQLWRAGLRSRDELRKATLADLVRVQGIGPTVAASIKRELGEQPDGEPAREVVERRPAER